MQQPQTQKKDPIHTPIHSEYFMIANPNRWWPLIIGLSSLFTSMILGKSSDIGIGLFLPILLYVVFGAGVISFFWFPKRKRKVNIFRDRVEVEAKNHTPEVFLLEKVKRIRTDRRYFYLDHDLKKELQANPKAKGTLSPLMVGKGRKGKIQGLVEMLLEHRESIPASVWSGFYLGKEDLKHKKVQLDLQRTFHNEEGEPLFMDRGLMVQSGDENWFFPTTRTVAIVPKRQAGAVSSVMKPGEFNPIPRFEPDPERLPIRALCIALLEANLSAEESKQTFSELAEQHGGCLLEKDLEYRGWKGTTSGYSVFVDSGK